MIVKMKKVYLVVLDSVRSKALEKLRELGVIHVQREFKSSDSVNSLLEMKTLFEKGEAALSSVKENKKTVSSVSNSAASNFAKAEKIALRISAIQEKTRQLEDENEKSLKDISSFIPWGDFDPSDVKLLSEKGILFRFYALTKEQFDKIPENVKYFLVNKIKNMNYIATVQLPGEDAVDFSGIGYDSLNLPLLNVKALEANIAERSKEIEALNSELGAFAGEKGVLDEGLKELITLLEFESISAEMETDEQFAWLSGYVPVDKVPLIEKEAANMHWAFLARDPEGDELPPTYIRNPKWIDIIKPLFNFLDITPGYKEVDVSIYFLMFFSLFVAMIVGDAGYGIIFLIFTTLLGIKKAPKPLVALLAVLSIGTITWGVITGTWFGSVTIVKDTFLHNLVIPEIASFGKELFGVTSGQYYIQSLCFYIGMVHLIIGLIISFLRKMPSAAAWADVGWALVLFAAYFVAQVFVLGAEGFHPLTVPLAVAGFVMVCLFSEQNGNFFKGVAMGIAWSPMKLLDCVSMFANLVSYIRLFAVGLATVAVASSFNTMAAGLAESMGIIGIIIGAVILFAAHSFNMILALLSVVVHGVRLNTLEFGGRVGLEWSGHNYVPFKK